jgi:DNA-binding transcriptional MerR regulator
MAAAPGTTRPAPATVLRIGDLAAAAGVSVDALRYYERRGLIRPTSRRASGYREYPPDAVGLVRFIKRAQALGFTLAEVDELVRIRGASRRTDAALEAREVAMAKIRDIDERLRQLGALRSALAELVTACERTCGPIGPAPDDGARCPIIDALDDASGPEPLTPVLAGPLAR